MSRATTPRPWAPSTAGRPCAPGTPITPLDLAGRGLHRPLPGIPDRPAERAARYAIVQAEDEIASIGHRRRGPAGTARGPSPGTSGPGISPDAGVRGPFLFRRDPGGDLRCAKGGPLDRHADAKLSVGHPGAAYASHGDTSTRCSSPEDRGPECFEMGALAFDLAERLQTCIFVMLDLDIGMNEWLCRPFAWDDERPPRSGQGDDLRAAGGG